MSHQTGRSKNPTFSVQAPAVHVPSSIMYAHPSRMMDAWVPDVERILLPEFIIPESTIHVSVACESQTFAKVPFVSHLSPFAQLKREIRRKLSRLSLRANVPEHLILDCRGKDTNNIAHIIHDVLLRVEVSKKLLEETKYWKRGILVVLPKRVSKLTQAVLTYLEIPILITDGPVKGNILEFRMNGASADEIVYGLLSRLGKMKIPNYIQNTPQKIFISRKDSRQILNEDQVEEYLSSRGYQKLYFDELSFEEQWSTSRNATDIVAIHGAALGSIAFNRRGTGENFPFRLTELFTAAFVVDPFRRFTAALGGSWVGVRGQISPEIVKDLDFGKKIFQHAYDPFHVDLKCLSLALEHHQK